MTTAPPRPRPTRLQRRVVRALMRDQQRLIATMQRDLVRLFTRLGSIYAQAYLNAAPRAQRAIDPADTAMVNRIQASARITTWDMAPTYNTAYLRTLNATADTVSLTMGLAVQLPDAIGRRVVREGGRRIGLVDVQGQSRTALFNALADGREQGLARGALARTIRDRIARGRYRSVNTRAMVIARTETAHAQRVSSLEVYRSMDAVQGVMAFDAQIGMTDADCEQRDGLVYSFQDAETEQGFEHPLGTLSWAPSIREPSGGGGVPPATTPEPPVQRTRRPRAPRQPRPRPTKGVDARQRMEKIAGKSYDELLAAQAEYDKVSALPYSFEQGKQRFAALQRLEKARKAYGTATRRVLREIIEHGGERASVQHVLSGNVTKARAKIVRDGVAQVERMIPAHRWNNRRGAIDVHLTGKYGRSNYGSIHGPGQTPRINLADGGDEIRSLVHELGHAWDDQVRENLEDALAHVYSRTKGDAPLTMAQVTGNQGYGLDEITRPDKFFDPYMGKEYSLTHAPFTTTQRWNAYAAGNNNLAIARNPWTGGETVRVTATELTSMSLESILRNPIAFARADPDSFDWVFERVLR